MKKKVLVTYNLPHEWLSSLNDDFDIIFPNNDTFSRENVLSLINDVYALLSMFSFNVDRDIIDAGKKLKIISNFGVGFNNIDIQFAKEKSIVVTNTPAPVIEPTAELAFALMSDLARNVTFCNNRLREPNSLKWGVMQNLGEGLYGKTLGIIGLGRIGLSIAKRALASGMNVIYHNRNRRDDDEFTKCKYVSFDELLSLSDYISLNTPLSDETFHLFDEKTFDKMKNSAYIINTSRGAVIDEKALVEALNLGKIKGAALDVYEFEPKITSDLLQMDNVVLVPHIGTATISARKEMADYACRNILNYFHGENVLSRVV